MRLTFENAEVTDPYDCLPNEMGQKERPYESTEKREISRYSE